MNPASSRARSVFGLLAALLCAGFGQTTVTKSVAQTHSPSGASL